MDTDKLITGIKVIFFTYQVIPSAISILLAYALIAFPIGLLGWVTKSKTHVVATIMLISSIISVLEIIILTAVLAYMSPI